MYILIETLVAALALNGIMFLIAYWLQSDKLTDISYAISFIGVALLILVHAHKTPYAFIGTGLVIVWGVRIGAFLLRRVLHVGKDRRFDGIREKFVKFGTFWLGQAITAWILTLPIALALQGNSTWKQFAILGISIWLAGLVIETIADQQKYRFRSQKHAQHPWIDSGLWHYARHPNYFGEILVWVGVYVYALPNLGLLGKVIGIISPIFITILLLRVSGIPILEKNADERWGDKPEYQQYKQRTRLLIPLPKKG